MTDCERIPWRVDGRLTRVLGDLADLEVCAHGPDALPGVRCVLPRRATTKVSVLVRVHSRAGIPLASATVDLDVGDSEFETPLTLLAMEGYTHLSRRARREVERRVWSRRAFATGSVS